MDLLNIKAGIYRIWWKDGDRLSRSEYCDAVITEGWSGRMYIRYSPSYSFMHLDDVVENIHTIIEVQPDKDTIIESVKSCEKFHDYNQRHTEYRKLVKGDVVYYIRTELIGEVCEKLLAYTSRQHSTPMLFADFAINTRTNEVVKCRYELEQIFDKFCGVHNG